MKYFSTLIVAAGIALGGSAASAQNFALPPVNALLPDQFDINVGGTIYTIGFYTGSDQTADPTATGANWENYKIDNDTADPGFTPQGGTVSQTPWWGSSALAKAFSNAFLTQVSFPAAMSDTIPATGNAYLFGYSEFIDDDGQGNTELLVRTWGAAYDENAVPVSGTSFERPLGDDQIESFDYGQDPVIAHQLNWAVVLSTNFNERPVPEIDGPVMVQVGFALMGLYVLMLGRRRREDEVDMSQAA